MGGGGNHETSGISWNFKGTPELASNGVGWSEESFLTNVSCHKIAIVGARRRRRPPSAKTSTLRRALQGRCTCWYVPAGTPRSGGVPAGTYQQVHPPLGVVPGTL